ncbi:hypothetical protein F903_01771 [Acinetobacter sp. NIPH 298]|nr:hypothetical protein F903_01771 [Acinetobacter sp. NIPH 298]
MLMKELYFQKWRKSFFKLTLKKMMYTLKHSIIHDVIYFLN